MTTGEGATAITARGSSMVGRSGPGSVRSVWRPSGWQGWRCFPWFSVCSSLCFFFIGARPIVCSSHRGGGRGKRLGHKNTPVASHHTSSLTSFTIMRNRRRRESALRSSVQQEQDLESNHYLHNQLNKILGKHGEETLQQHGMHQSKRTICSRSTIAKKLLSSRSSTTS